MSFSSSTIKIGFVRNLLSGSRKIAKHVLNSPFLLGRNDEEKAIYNEGTNSGEGKNPQELLPGFLVSLSHGGITPF
jgi:hypothetical protein